MAVVSKQEYYYPDENCKNKRVLIPIKFSARDGLFSMPIPADAGHLVVLNAGMNTVTDNTLEGVKKRFGELIATFKKNGTKKERLIAYMFDVNWYLMDDDNEVCLHGYSTQSRSLELNYDYLVVDRYTVGTAKTYYKLITKSHGKDIEWEMSYSFNSDEYKFVDYTPQREEFFRQMKHGFLGLINKLEEFFGKADLMKLIDSGKIQNLLPAGGEDVSDKKSHQ